MTRVDVGIRSKIGDPVKDKDVDENLICDFLLPPVDLFVEDDVVKPVVEESTKQDADDYTKESYYEYLTAQILLPQGGEMTKAKVTGRNRDAEGLPMGRRNRNPLLDSRLYEVEFPDGSTDAFTANIIAENMFSQVDDEGLAYSILDEVVDHRTNGHALSKDDGYFEDRNGKRHPRRTTKGWELEVEWRDGTTTWVPLKDLKEPNPVEVAEYAVANKLAEEPAFAWWIRKVLRRRDQIIKKANSRNWSCTHK